MDKTDARRDGCATGISCERAAYDELQCYTLALGDADFVHQHVVDAWAAQHATEKTKPIGLAFALVGLFLHLEEGLSGRQVQKVHMALARRRQDWPSFALPENRGSVTAVDVMAAPAGPDRDRAIDAWCASVWDAFAASHEAVAELLESHIGPRERLFAPAQPIDELDGPGK
ncbi:MAG: DUF5946 family protein [Gemmatimonadota bacterium]